MAGENETIGEKEATNEEEPDGEERVRKKGAFDFRWASTEMVPKEGDDALGNLQGLPSSTKGQRWVESPSQWDSQMVWEKNGG